MKSKFLQCLSHQIVDHSPTYGKFIVDTGAKFSLHNRAPLCLQHPPGAERTPLQKKSWLKKPHCPKNKLPSGENPLFFWTITEISAKNRCTSSLSPPSTSCRWRGKLCLMTSGVPYWSGSKWWTPKFKKIQKEWTIDYQFLKFSSLNYRSWNRLGQICWIYRVEGIVSNLQHFQY